MLFGDIFINNTLIKMLMEEHEKGKRHQPNDTVLNCSTALDSAAPLLE